MSLMRTLSKLMHRHKYTVKERIFFVGHEYAGLECDCGARKLKLPDYPDDLLANLFQQWLDGRAHSIVYDVRCKNITWYYDASHTDSQPPQRGWKLRVIDGGKK